MVLWLSKKRNEYNCLDYLKLEKNYFPPTGFFDYSVCIFSKKFLVDTDNHFDLSYRKLDFYAKTQSFSFCKIFPFHFLFLPQLTLFKYMHDQFQKKIFFSNDVQWGDYLLCPFCGSKKLINLHKMCLCSYLITLHPFVVKMSLFLSKIWFCECFMKIKNDINCKNEMQITSCNYENDHTIFQVN